MLKLYTRNEKIVMAGCLFFALLTGWYLQKQKQTINAPVYVTITEDAKVEQPLPKNAVLSVILLGERFGMSPEDRCYHMGGEVFTADNGVCFNVDY